MRDMGRLRTLLIAVPLAALALACNTSGLSEQPRATFGQIACMDVNGDSRVNAADAADPSKLPDWNADRDRDEFDASFLDGVDIELDPNRDPALCDGDSKRSSEYLVAHGYFSSSDVSCDADGGGANPVLLVGIGGGSVNLRDEDDAAGVRSMIDEVQKEYGDRDVDTVGVIAGPAIGGALNGHAAMEDWLTHAVRTYFERYPCIKAVIVGHSHGAVTADVVSARLEAEFADRFIAVVDVDRVEALYTGDTASRPAAVSVFNIFEQNDPRFQIPPFDGANVENWDATAEEAPEHGQDGGDMKPVNHTTIDNSEAVAERIVEEVMERSEATVRDE
jgi:hypothetical protein